LDTVVFVGGIASGEPLFRRRRAPNEPVRPVEPTAPYRAGMTSIEIRQLFEDTVARVYETALVSTRNLAPNPVAGGDGFRFETLLTGRDEVAREGVVYGAVRGGKLYLVWFQGTQLYHFGRHVADVERMIGTMQLPAGAGT
jgi:hypothetical protein